MHLSEMLVYAAAFAQTYNENYPAYDHPVAIARAVQNAWRAVDALRNTPDNCALNNLKIARYREPLNLQAMSDHCGPETEPRYLKLWEQFVTSDGKA
jgi:hypothetical protein